MWGCHPEETLWTLESSNAMISDNRDLASVVKRREGEVEPVKNASTVFLQRKEEPPTPAYYLSMAAQQVGLDVPLRDATNSKFKTSPPFQLKEN